MSGFDKYLETLLASWEALAAPHGGTVIRDRGFAASVHPYAVLNNAIVLDGRAVGAAGDCYAEGIAYALWSRADDASIATALQARGYVRDITTRPMVCDLGHLPDPPDVTVLVDAHADPGLVAELNGVPAELLRAVRGVRAVATPDYASALVLLPVGADVNVSFVATRPADRRRGLAGAVTRTALTAVRSEGFDTASLQATPMAEGMYAALGFEPVGRWQEWLPGTHPS